MSKVIMEREFWTDNQIIDEYSPEDKLFMLYLLTCPRGTAIGIYKIPIKLMAFEIGYSPEAIRTLIDRFMNKYDRIKYDYDRQEIAIKNCLKYTISKGGKPVEDMVRLELKNVDNGSLIEYVYGNMTTWWSISERAIDKTIQTLFENELSLRDINVNVYDYVNVNDNVYGDTGTVSSHDSYKALNINDNSHTNDTANDTYTESLSDSGNYGQLSTHSDEWLVKDYFYSHVKANSDRSDEKFVDEAIKKYGWREVLLTMTALKDEQHAKINTFKYVQTALERNHDQYLIHDEKGYYDWLINKKIRALRTGAING